MHDKAVCRTALATLGLFKICIYIYLVLIQSVIDFHAFICLAMISMLIVQRKNS